MASIDRTAYPRFNLSLSPEEIEAAFAPSPEEIAFVRSKANGDAQRLRLLVLLKSLQHLGYIPAIRQVPEALTEFLRQQLDLPPATSPVYEAERSRHRYYRVLRAYLGLKAYPNGGQAVAEQAIRTAAYTMSDPADLINVAIEELIRQCYELPAYSTLDRLVAHLREQVHLELYDQVHAALSREEARFLDGLLEVRPGEHVSDFNRLKHRPGPTTQRNMHRWSQRLKWLDALLETTRPLAGLAHTKIRQFASEAHALDLGDVQAIRSPAKRRTFLVALLHQAQVHTRDELVEMFLKRMRRTHNRAREKLAELQEQHRELEEEMLATFAAVVHEAAGEQSDEELGRQVRAVLERHGGVAVLREQYETVSAYHRKNYLPLLWPIHRSHRAGLFRLLDQLDLRSATQDRTLLDALHFVQAHRTARRDRFDVELDLSFASGRWRSFVQSRERGRGLGEDRSLLRRELEVCVLSYVADALQCGDLYVVGSEHYADYREQLLPWSECEQRLAPYCEALGIASEASAYVEALRTELRQAVRAVDASFAQDAPPEMAACFTIDDAGKPHLKRLSARRDPAELSAFKARVHGRLPERHLLDVLKDVECWSGFTRHFGPLSGSDPKLRDATRRYLLAVFGYGCNLGVNQTERHARAYINRHTLRRINAQHVTTTRLDAALRDIIAEYTRFELPFFWGTGERAIADGTHIELIENNLLGERHIRYGGYGGIAYHHISDLYIALFSHFVACGVWEAVYILDGLLKNKAEALQPMTVHGDTQGQSEPAFGLARLLGIQLMPRMRNWSDVTFYRPDRQTRYRHIDPLFTQVVDWELIETHWRDMMQVVLSIQAGRVLPSMLLRKLGTKNTKNRLYRAFRELGRVERTLFLLRYLSEPELRRGIRAEMTKIEAYNDFTDWIAFGGPKLKSGDPVEQEKRIKYRDVVANAVMLSNVADLTKVLHALAEEGYPVTRELVARLSPYQTEHIRRFGQYVLDMDEEPEPLLLREVALVG